MAQRSRGPGQHAKLLERAFFNAGFIIGSYPLWFIAASLVFIGSLGSGIQHLNIVQNPQAIWVPPGSPTAQQQSYFGKSFEPFFRIEQAIFMKKAGGQSASNDLELSKVVDGLGYTVEAATNASQTCQDGNIITIATFKEMLRIQNAIVTQADSSGH